jgi:hypothetical protein
MHGLRRGFGGRIQEIRRELPKGLEKIIHPEVTQATSQAQLLSEDNKELPPPPLKFAVYSQLSKQARERQKMHRDPTQNSRIANTGQGCLLYRVNIVSGLITTCTSNQLRFDCIIGYSIRTIFQAQ